MRSFQSGMMLPSGQPLWQKGIPQSMQRAPCARSLSSGSLRSYSRQSCNRSATGRRSGVSRLISMNPVIFPIFSPILFQQHIALPLFFPTGRPATPRAFFHQYAPPSRILRDSVFAMSNTLGKIFPEVACATTARLHRGQTRHVGIHAQMLALEHRAVLGGHHPDEFGGVIIPVAEYALGELAPGVLMMAHD